MPTRQRKSTPAEIAATEPEETPELDASAPLDLTAELEDMDTFEVVIEGHHFNFPLLHDWPPAARRHFRADDHALAYKSMGFSDEDAEYLETMPERIHVSIIRRAEELSGISLGESKSSEKSSRSAGTRSKRTSARSTGSTSATTTRRGSAQAS